MDTKPVGESTFTCKRTNPLSFRITNIGEDVKPLWSPTDGNWSGYFEMQTGGFY